MNKRILLIVGLCLLGCGREEEVVKETETPYKESKAIFQPAQIQPKQIVQVIPAMPQTRTNPFLTQEEEKDLSYLGKAVLIDYLVLSGILYSRVGSKAIINGQILRVGDSIDNKEIIEIQPEAVILKDAQSEYIMRLKSVMEK